MSSASAAPAGQRPRHQQHRHRRTASRPLNNTTHNSQHRHGESTSTTASAAAAAWHAARGKPFEMDQERSDEVWRQMSANPTARNSIGKKSMHSRDGSGHRSKEGHQFRVGNIGNNGLLYLRPISRQTQPIRAQSPPMTPPLSDDTSTGNFDDADWRDSLMTDSNTAWSTNYRFGSPGKNNRPDTPRTRPIKHIPAVAVGQDTPPQDTNPNEVTIIIKRSSSSPPTRRSRLPPTVWKGNPETRDHMPGENDLLGVTIPHYRLGTPRFNGRGSAILRSSLNTGTATHSDFEFSDDMRSSVLSSHSFSLRGFPAPPGRVRRHSATEFGSQEVNALDADTPSYISRPRHHSSQIIPSLDGTVNQVPGRVTSTISVWKDDDPFLVQLSPVTGQVVVATPSGLIAQITSPNILDYELLSDFFLTFRSFLSPSNLAICLINRLRWAVTRNDDFGRIVRVRTFVAIRHWILNYFVEDFVASLPLRRQFCSLVNGLCKELQLRHDARDGDVKILGELKRCWRRTCALYWDLPRQSSIDVAEDILPGGQLGTRSSPLPNEEALDVDDDNDELQTGDPLETSKRAAGAAIAALSRNPIPDAMPPPSFRTTRATRIPRTTSDQSAINVMSCAVLTKSHHHKDNAPPSSSEQAKSVGKTHSKNRNRRSASFSDSLRDNRTPFSMSGSAGPEISQLSHALRFPGVLVRGGLYPPVPPYVDSIVPGSPLNEDSAFIFKVTDDEDLLYPDERGSGPGVQGIMSSMKRALSTKRRPSPLQINGNEPPRRKSNASGETKASGPHPRLSQSTSKRKLVRGVVQLRIDLLSAEIMESWHAVMQPDPLRPKNVEALAPVQPLTTLGPAHTETDFLTLPEALRMNSDISMGSRSIVIIDATGERYPLGPDIDDPSDDGPAPLASHSIETADQIGQAQTTDVVTDGDEGLESTPQPSLRSRLAPDDTYLRPQTAINTSEMGEGTLKSIDQLSAFSDDASKTSTNDPFYLDKTPIRQLRRRPGGDLRAADHVHSLELHPPPLGELSEENLHRHELSHSGKSKGTLSATEETRRSRGHLSMMDTHSSQPVMRPSFEREVAKLALLGDEDSVDGGVDATLLKLEGKHPKTPVTATFPDGLGLAVTTDNEIGLPVLSEQTWAQLNRASKGRANIHTDEAIPSSPAPSNPSQRGTHRAAESSVDERSLAGRNGRAGMRKPIIDVGPAPTRDLPAPPLTGTSLPSLVATERELSSPDSDMDRSDFRWLQVSLPPTVDQTGATVVKINATPRTDYDSSPTAVDNPKTLVRIHGVAAPGGMQRNANFNQQSGMPSHVAHPSSSDRSHESFLLNENESLRSNTPTYDWVVDGTPREAQKSSWFRENSVDGSLTEKDAAQLMNRQREDGSELEYAEYNDLDGEDNGDAYMPDTGITPAEDIGLALTTSAPDTFFVSSDQESHTVDANQYQFPLRTMDGLLIKQPSGKKTPRLNRQKETERKQEQETIPVPPALNFTTPQVRLDSRHNSERIVRTVKKPSTGLVPPVPKTVSAPTTPLTAAHPTLEPEAQPRPSMSNTPIGAHLPWVLAFDSRLIAQQMTLVEKDALSEIDWRELIEIQWKQDTTPLLNWVDYIKTDSRQDSQFHRLRGGVDVCIARFNLVVKWAISEIVLTQDPSERLSTIIKYIHIAQHCRNLRNWATMYQLTMALINSEVSRLKNSWAAVPETEREILASLEELILPIRNFHNLRTAMESAAVLGASQTMGKGTGGCIPFIGVYTHDLIYNAQKPEYIVAGDSNVGTHSRNVSTGVTAGDSGVGLGLDSGVVSGSGTGRVGEPWVNFERHHTAAAIVKNLLRMLDESSKYSFEPVPDVLSRCLWMSALDEKEIQRRSRLIEP